MSWLVEIVLVNSLAAGLLALLATVLARWIRRPAIVHALWLLVLLKLVTPPVFRVEALPGLDALAAGPVPAVERVAPRAPHGSVTPPPAVERGPAPVRITPARAAGTAWIGGSGLLLSLVVIRCFRFRRLIASSARSSEDLRRRTEWLAEKMGLRRCPTVRVVEGRLPPMLWWRPGPGALFLPAGLLRRLDRPELDALIVHELAHVRRRDHCVRWVETATIALFWWNPVTWWARRNLRIAEEKACDAWVLELLPGRSRAYAEGILKTVDYISGQGSGIPILATGAAETRHLKERLTMIMSPKRPLRTRPGQRWALALLALALLLVFPTAQRGPGAAPPVEDAETQNDAQRRSLLELEQEAMELEYRLSRLRAQRAEIEQAIQREAERIELDAMRGRVEELRRQGRDDEAAAVEDELAEWARRRDIESRMSRAEREHQSRLRDRELDLQRTALALEEARLSGDPARSAALEEEVRLLELEMRHAALDELRHRAQHEQELVVALEQEARARGRAEAERERRHDEFERLAAELTARLETIELEMAGADAAQAAELERAARELRRVLKKLQAERRP